MTASNPGPDQYGYAQDPNDPSGASDGGLGTVLRTVVLAAGVLVSLFAFAKFYNYDGTAGYNVTPALLPLTAALLTGASLLPRQTEQRAAVAAVAMAGFVTTLFAALQPPISLSLAGAAYLILLLTLVQAAAALGALLVHSGVVSLPSPRPGPAYYDSRGYGPPAQYNSSEYGPSAQTAPPTTRNSAPTQPAPGYATPNPQYGQHPHPGQYGPGMPGQPGTGSQQGQQQPQTPGQQSSDPATQVFRPSGAAGNPENPEGGPHP